MEPESHQPVPEAADAGERTLLSRRSLEILGAMLIIGFGGLIVMGALEFDIGWDDRGPGTGYFPFWVGIVVLIGGIGALGEGLLGRNLSIMPALTHGQLKRATTFVVPIFGFLLIASFLGLYVGMTVYLFVVMIWQGGYRLPVATTVSVGTAAFFFVMFEKLLKVSLMMGPIEAWFGIN